MPKCNFCGEQINIGTGKQFIYANGKLLNLCSNKCEKNMLKLKRKPLKVKWTKTYRDSKGKTGEKKQKVITPTKQEIVVEQKKGSQQENNQEASSVKENKGDKQ